MKHMHKAQKPSADLLLTAHVKMSFFQRLADRDDKDRRQMTDTICSCFLSLISRSCDSQTNPTHLAS